MRGNTTADLHLIQTHTNLSFIDRSMNERPVLAQMRIDGIYASHLKLQEIKIRWKYTNTVACNVIRAQFCWINNMKQHNKPKNKIKGI